MTRIAGAILILVSLQITALAETAADPPGMIVSRVETGAGAELLTIFSRSNGSSEPVLSILRDTLGDADPSNDKIRQIWVLTYARPSLQQRLAASLPSFYRKSGTDSSGSKPPAPVLDYSATRGRALNSVFGRVLQTVLLDANGLWPRTISRSYHGNALEYRNTRISHALGATGGLEYEPELSGLSPEEFLRIQGRLILTQRFFGDLVGESHLEATKKRNDMRQNATVGRNWEILRQEAEKNSLYFQPFTLGPEEISYVLLWVAREDLAQPPSRAFDGKLLNISSPWTDPRLKQAPGVGYSETWHFDDQNRVRAGGDGLRAVEMIPLALYSLDHPKSPLLVVDFRSQGKVRRTEIGRRAIDTAIAALPALTGFGGWTSLGVRKFTDFLRGRRGTPLNRQARTTAYASLRSALAGDTSLSPQLHSILTESVNRLLVNPFERDIEKEFKLARQQYQALASWAVSSKGLAQRLDRDRRAEMVPLVHGKPSRALFGMARVLSLGIYRHREEFSPELMAELDRSRRLAYYGDRLQRALEKGQRPEVASSVSDVGASLEALTLLAEQDTFRGKQVARVVSQLFRQTADDGLRRQSLDSLSRMKHGKAGEERARLLTDFTPLADSEARQGADNR